MVHKGGAPIGSQNAVKHGGAGAMQRISKGQPLIGIAHEAELQVQAEYEAQGPAALELREVQRLAAAADLYWNAVSKAAEVGDLAAIDRYIQRYGWLASLALRGWTEIRKRERNSGGGGQSAELQHILEVINEYNKPHE